MGREAAGVPAAMYGGAAALHDADVCVIGGGMAGLAAALSAARRGAEVVCMHDRPVLGGNASSECRVHICGADRHNSNPNARETGILEELRLRNLSVNPQQSFSVWDTVLYDTVRRQERLKVLLNCSCQGADVAGGRIASVAGWQATTYTRHVVRAKVFIDCSGDAILAPLTGAAFRVGREGRDEYGESLAPEAPDAGTMGMTLAFSAVEHDRPQPFTPPPWARRFERCEDLPGDWRSHGWWRLGYWWVELGGMDDSIHDTEKVRDDLLAVLYGVWDHVKNRCAHHRDAAANWALDWVQFLPAKRESRRYVGRHVLTQQEVMSGGKFPDAVAYGGWTIDEHPPVGVRCAEFGLQPAYHAAPPLYGIPYGVLVAGSPKRDSSRFGVPRDVENLMFAGRCASCTHIAMSSTRVMGTAAVMGQAAGTAAAMAVRRGVAPAGLADGIDELQQALLADDAYLPGVRQRFNDATARADYRASAGDPRPLRDGINRPVGRGTPKRDASRLGDPDDDHAWGAPVGATLEIRLAAPAIVRRLVLIADSSLHLEIQMSFWQADDQLTAPPASLAKAATVEVLADGRWQASGGVRDNDQRLIRIPVGRRVEAVRVRLDDTWGADPTRLFAAYVE